VRSWQEQSQDKIEAPAVEDETGQVSGLDERETAAA
jgi:hypothetical protein